MATVIGVGMQMTANAAGMTSGLSEADRALQLLQKIVEQNQQGLKKFATESDTTAKSLDKLTRGVSILSSIEIGRVLVGGFQQLAGVFTSAAQSVLTLAGNVSQSLDSLNDLSARTGIGVESLQGYALAAKMAGVDTEAFGSAVQKLAVNIGKAAPGDALDKSLRQINLSVTELRALSPEQQFSAIGNAISQLPTAADRAAAAVELFGKQGAALAPLFREGAASIEELKARAERLGIIVSETQINNVADMNDAFDLVSATINGIIGQVTGNLAPAVTAVANDFLKFVETYNGIDGAVGGTAFANAITDAFIEGAHLFISVMAKFSDVAKEIAAALGVDLRSDAEKRLAALEAQVAAGTAPQIALDPTGFVTELAPQFLAEITKLREQVAEEATQSAAASAQGFLADFANIIKERRLPEIQLATNVDSVRERLLSFLDEAGAGASEFLQQSVDTLDTFQAQIDAGGLVADQMAVMNGFAERLNAELDKELALRRQDAEAAAAQASADEKRVEGMLKTSDAAGKLQEDLAAVERERQRIESAGGEDAQRRLEQLDALKKKIEDEQQALDQGFGQSFQKAFEGADKAIDTAIVKAAEFGQAGFDAAQQLADGIATAQRQAEGGILTKEAYDSEVARQQAIFEQRIANEKKVAEEATKLRVEQEKVVAGLLFSQQYNGDADRIKAAENLVALNAEITRAEEAAAAAREAGDQEALRAAATRIQQLDQVQAREEDIASGAAGQRKKYQEQLSKQQEAAGKAQQQQQQAYLQEQAKAAEERRKAEEAEYQRQVARINELNTLGPQTVQTADVRTQEGAALVLGLAANAQDPALIEAKLQTKQLNAIALGIAKAAANYFNQPVAIVGSAVLG